MNRLSQSKLHKTTSEGKDPAYILIPAPLAGWVELEEECEEGDIRSWYSARLTLLWGNDCC